MDTDLHNIIFVGSFVTEAKDGTVGGQGFACQSLVASTLSEKINWHLIDTTQKTQPPPSLPIRFYYAGVRLLKLVRMLAFNRVSCVLIFSSFSIVSFSEKGVMLLLASVFKKRTVLAIRSEVKASNLYAKSSWFRKSVLKNCTTIVCQSQVNTAALLEFDPTLTDKVITIPNWLNTAPFENIPTKQSPEVINFMYMGWLIEHKGIIDLINAAEQLLDENHDFRLHICGGGPLAQTLQDRVAHGEYDKITFHNWIYGEDKIAMLNKCDVLILPSHTEGMSNSMLEAMAAGMGIIATRVGAATEVINSPSRGRLADPKSVESIQNAMLHYINEKQQVEINSRENKAYIETNHRLNIVLPKFAAALNVEYQAQPAPNIHARQ